MRLTSIFKVVAVAALSFVAVSCATNEAKFALGDNAPVVPMGIAKGETTHYLTDYYPQWVGAESITTADERLTLENLSGDWSEFAVKTDAETLVSTIEVYHDGKPLSIVVLGGKRDTEGSYMSTMWETEGRIGVFANKSVKGAVAVWQNNVIEDVLVDGALISVAIPAEAKNFDRSVVRIFAASETGRFNDVLVPL